VKSNKVMKNDCWIWSVRTTNNLPISNNAPPPNSPPVPPQKQEVREAEGSKNRK